MIAAAAPFKSNNILLFSLLLVLPCSCVAYISTNGTTDASIIYSRLSSKFYNLSPLFQRLIIFWSALELAFYFYFVYTRQRLQATSKPAKSLTQRERSSLFWNCVQTINDIESWSEGWFYYKKDHSHPQFKEIQRENMALWFAWAFWHEHLDIVRQTQAWADEIEWMLSSAETWFSLEFPPGLNADLQCIRLSLDPVQAYHRPLVLYVGVYVLTAVFNTVLLQWAWGFQHNDCSAAGIVWGGVLSHVHDAVEYMKASLLPLSTTKSNTTTTTASPKRISYYYKNTTSTTSAATPLVFVHGIGAGLVCYAEFVHQLSRQMNRPIFLVELPYVAMHMVDDVPSATETVSEITAMLNTFGYTKAVYISHSLGTGVSSWIMNMAPHTVAGLVMIDPICFLLHYHHVAFNFVHRIPSTLFEHLLHFMASRELYISNYISRHFQWFETIYFSQPGNCSQAPCVPAPLDMKGPLANATVFLSEKDSIVGSPAVHTYLTERGVDTRIMDGLEHAMFLMNGKWKNTIIQQIATIARQADKVVSM